MLAKAIRENDDISGILVNNKEIKLSQYADDTTLILDGSRESLTASLKTLDDFYEISGLKLNDKKTEALWIGANCGNEEISLPGRNFKWPKHKVKAFPCTKSLVKSLVSLVKSGSTRLTRLL